MDGGAGWPEAGRKCARGATKRIRSVEGNAPKRGVMPSRRMPGVTAERLPCDAEPGPCFHREEEAGLRSVGDLVHGILLSVSGTGAVRVRDSPPAYPWEFAERKL